MNPIRCCYRRGLAAPLLVALLAAAGGPVAQAQTAAAEAAATQPAFPAFAQWVSATPPAAAAAAPARIEPLPLVAAKGGTVAPPFEPLPVILGTPDLPLSGSGGRQAAGQWGSGPNYQGLFVQLLLVEARTQNTRLVPLSTRLKPGQHFKIRLTATFDGVASIDQVLGTAWDAVRMGQAYPAAGQSVEVKASKPVELPLGEARYFVLDGKTARERLVLSVRHAKALGEARNTQPAYRQDGALGSSYLQLATRGTYPLIEQVLSTRR